MATLIFYLAVVILALGWWVAISAWPQLPVRIPVHFNLTGDPDRWGPRWMIFIGPLAGSVICAVLAWLFNRPDALARFPMAARVPLNCLLLIEAGLFAYLTWQMCRVAVGQARGLGVWFLPVLLGALTLVAVWLALTAHRTG
jgi:hypothetical protein